LESAAILKRCRLAVGADTSLAHISCAVGTSNVILMGGGHFGRFMPYSPLTSIVCLPLECYGCSLSDCRYEKYHCVEDIGQFVLVEALRKTFEHTSEKPRIFYQDASSWVPKPGWPLWQSFDKFLNTDEVVTIPVNQLSSVVQGMPQNSK